SYASASRVMVSGSTVLPAAALTVMAVRPEHRKLGVGERLVRHGLERCRGIKIDLVFASALPTFLARMGFQPAVPLGFKADWPVPEGEFSVFDLSGSRLGKASGTVTYPGPYHGS
ncbi:MAG: GNAT family N-acetyltransferase, partial [Elusimicrobia bacterium]|nr:GNAT family N-acetyltransferase [Elusimicrobiota bacterium]